nr:DUF1656 domain-containing protein [Chitinasiproducens palmae]
MPARESVLFGVYVPTLLLAFIAAAGLSWVLDRILTRVGAYRYLWHPSLFRLSLFACVFGVLGLSIYS